MDNEVLENIIVDVAGAVACGLLVWIGVLLTRILRVLRKGVDGGG